jgi:hypothetical protein
MVGAQSVVDKPSEPFRCRPALLRLREKRIAACLVAGVSLIALPAIFFTPLIPYADTIAFTYLNSYPAKASYGPLHYYTFQFTNILPHIISRALTDFGISPSLQVLLYYLLEGLSFYTAVSYILLRFVSQSSLLCLALVLSPLAFNDGLFVWGGPLAFSLGSVALAASVVLIVHSETAGKKPYAGLLALLALTGMISHPFVVPFFGIVHAAAFGALPRQRKASAGVMVLLAAYGCLIVKDSPETLPSDALWTFFSFDPSAIAQRFGSVFKFDALAITALLGSCSLSLRAYLSLVHAVQLAGLLGAVVAWRRICEEQVLRGLLLMYLGFIVLFAFAGDTLAISMWPQRILTFTSFLWLAFGWVAISKLLETPFPKVPRHLPERVVKLATVTLSVLLLGWGIALQWELLKNGEALMSAFRKTKKAVLESGANNARLNVSPGALAPFCMRAMPFMLFPDRDLRARGLIEVTEWHAFPRHNTRVGEVPGQGVVLLDFLAVPPYQVSPVVKIIAPVTFPLKLRLAVRFGDRTPAVWPGDPILTTGKMGDGNFLVVCSPRPGVVAFGVDRWGSVGKFSPLVLVDGKREYRLDVSLGEQGIRLDLDGTTVWQYLAPMGSLEDVKIGTNDLGGTASGPRFSGTIRSE